MSGTDSIFHANGVCVDSPGCNPWTAQSHVFRPNGADGTHVVRHVSNVPCAPLGRGIPVADDSRVSPFAITAYPVGITNSVGITNFRDIPTPTASTAIARGAAPGLIVEMIEPYQGRVYDPAMGSGSFHSVRPALASVFRPKGASCDSPGQHPGFGSLLSRAMKGRPMFTRDKHPDLSLSRQSAATPDADFVMALPSAAARSLPRSHPADRPNGRINPPFNIGTQRKAQILNTLAALVLPR